MKKIDLKEVKNPGILAAVLCVLGIVFGGLLAGVNALTQPKIQALKQAKLEAELVSVNVTEPNVVDCVKLDGVNAVYSGKVEGESVYVVSCENKNSYTTISVLVVIKDGIVVNASLSGSPLLTTHGMDDKFTLEGLTLVGAESENDITAVSGATFSSGSVKTCIKTALDQVKSLQGGAE